MSDPIRIAVVAEGKTDFEILKPIIESLISPRPFILTPLQPEGSEAFSDTGDAGEFGGGWVGVCRWCFQSRDLTNGQIELDPLFVSNDVLIVHIDADVAHKRHTDAPSSIQDELAGQLPCGGDCPPVASATEPLRSLVIQWLGATPPQSKLVICVPSKSMEAWVVPMLFPSDKEARKKSWECFKVPESRLAQQKVKVRIKKTQADYRRNSEKFKASWSRIANRLGEAGRFQTDLQNAFNEV